MLTIRMPLIALLVAGSAPAATMAADLGVQTPAMTTRALLDAFPGVQRLVDGQATYLYAVPMTAGDTDALAANAFLTQYGNALGATPDQFELQWSAGLNFGQDTVFAYQQRVGGLTVERSAARIVVNNDIGHRVVLAAARVAGIPANGLTPATISSAAALHAAQADPALSHLPEWSTGELVVYAGEDLDQPARPTWKFVADNNDRAHRERRIVLVDAVSSAIRYIRNGLAFENVVGTIKGYASPGTKPDEFSNPPVALPIPDIRMAITGGSNAISDAVGNFSITNAGTTPVTVTTDSQSGRWLSLRLEQGSFISLSNSVTPGVPTTLTLNDAPTQFTTAQTNAVIGVNAVHDYYRNRGGHSALDYTLPTYVNINEACNAYFDGGSINFYAMNGACNNTGYSTLIAHEYTHYVIQGLGLAQEAFGEGFADATAMLEYDTPLVGDDFYTTGQPLRAPVQAQMQYPCFDEIHACGQVLAGAWYSIRENIGAARGSATGLTITQQAEVSWSLITLGGPDMYNAAGPGTVIEVLTVDDDNGNLIDGTPNYASICSAFALYNLPCPTIVLASFQYPNGLPDTLPFGQYFSFPVNITGANSGVPVPGSATLTYSDGGDPIVLPMTQTAPNQYLATFPPQYCGARLNWYLSVQVNGGALTATDPPAAPAAQRTTVVATSAPVIFSDDFTTDKGWSYGAAGDTALTGVWNRMVSQATAAQPAGGHGGPTDVCAVTNGVAGPSIGANDVDNGRTTLVSPVFDLSGADGIVTYWRWFSSNQGPHPNVMTFAVDISGDGGATWANVETVGPSGAEVTGGWYFNQFRVGDKLAPTGNMKMRFVANDTIGAIIEAAIDDFQVRKIVSCNATCPNVGCAALDNTHDCIIDLGDLAGLLAQFGATGVNLPGDTAAPFGVIDLGDLSFLLAHFGQSCN